MFTFDITPDDANTFRVVATSRDVSHWERTGRNRSLAGIERDARMCDLEELAYLASLRKGHVTGTLAEFRGTCDVDPIDTSKDENADDEAGPTPADR